MKKSFGKLLFMTTFALTTLLPTTVNAATNANGVTLKDNWDYQKGFNYYYDNAGKLVTNKTAKISGVSYHFNDKGQLEKDKLLNQNGKVIYFTSTGEQAKDYFYKNWGRIYYFGSNGERYTNQWYSNWGHKYYFGSDGALYQDRLEKIDGKLYYFDYDGILATDQDITVDGVTYHANSKGVLKETTRQGFDESQINYDYALGSYEGSSQIASNYYIIMHDVGAESGGAANANYLRNNWTNAYTQFVVGDGGEVYEVGEPGYVSWGALNANPYSPVQIELGRTWDRNTFIKDYTAYINVARYYADKYGIAKTLDYGGSGTPGIKTHNWVTENLGGSHVDPYGYLASWGIDYDQFAHDLQYGINQSELNKTVYSYRQ